MPCVAIDVGNSRIKFGLFQRTAPADGRLPECLHSESMSVSSPIPWRQIREWVDAENDGEIRCVLAGSNPAGLDRLQNSWPENILSLPCLINSAARLPIECRLAEPQKVGIDRLLSAVAANRLRPPDCPAIVVDSGTATTVDYIAADGVFEGGAILPGIELAATSLHRYTALLPMIPVEELARESKHPLGRNTREALRSGLLYGQLGAIRELVHQLTPKPNINEPVVLLTGGAAALLSPFLPEADWKPHLAMQGLALSMPESDDDRETQSNC